MLDPCEKLSTSQPGRLGPTKCIYPNDFMQRKFLVSDVTF